MLNRIIAATLSLLFSLSSYAYQGEEGYDFAVNQDDYLDRVLMSKANKYGISYALLKSIAIHETNMSPWAINMDGESYFFDSQEELISFLTKVQKRQWLVKWRYNGKPKRKYFAREEHAHTYKNKVVEHYMGEVSFVDKKQPKNNEVIVRNIRMINTDLGLCQVNFRFHGKSGESVRYWTDINNNVDYAAKLLKSLLDKHKDPLKAAAFYHSNTPKFQKRYLKRFKPTFAQQQQELMQLYAKLDT